MLDKPESSIAVSQAEPSAPAAPGWGGFWRAVGMFPLAFVGCLFGIPLVSLALCAIAPVGLNGVCIGMYFPVFALWLGDGLRFGPWYGGPWEASVADCCFALVAVWLSTWGLFAWLARRLGARLQFLAAAGMILAVTVAMHLVMYALDIQLFVTWWL